MALSHILFSGFVPVGLPTVPRTKNNWKVAIFRPSRNLLDGQIYGFFGDLLKLEQRTKKYIGFVGICWIIPSMVAVNGFIPGRTKDLSALTRTVNKSL
jgi:hypothetical protein